ncbi:branched-chain amino acid transport system II carrier protein [Peptostreptococcus equinus]|uniref:Branched-chain amino acid transport system carrier protein n=1 Tax=Peptostreptococcus equinus TaxID=3003601 RepID=A0ABY7JTC2_9FIRM|nr:branched-chain amino acid transport system II carrier protein [Peptostreptococcus sp. CBA3647]WAW15413.1 branched-chain amino acid transport system II carrier protein [Peptostreptococcus sp. CBA3647]
MNNKGSVKDTLTFGFALFAMFFGAGNLIFPPYLGIISGPKWFTGFAGFTFADAGLALLAVIAIAYCNGNIMELFEKIGKWPAIILSFADIMCVGPLLVIPRTGATTYEMGIMPLAGKGLPIIVVVVIFFLLTFFLTVRPSKVIDIVGQFLTPVLIIALSVIIIKGVVSPLGTPMSKPMIENIFQRGIMDGYQTMDCFVSIAVGSVLMLTLANKGYSDSKQQIALLIKAGIIACVGLGLIYGGLTYLGSTVSKVYGMDVQQSQVIVNITQSLLGNTGKVILAIAVSLACLTTSIGLTSATAEYLTALFNNKISYAKVVAIVCVFATAAASMGVSGLVKIANPILAIVYPPTIVLIVLVFFKNKIKNDNVYKFAALFAVIISALTLLSTSVPAFGFVNSLPLAPIGFNWVVPTIIGGIIGNFVGASNKKVA